MPRQQAGSPILWLAQVKNQKSLIVIRYSKEAASAAFTAFTNFTKKTCFFQKHPLSLPPMSVAITLSSHGKYVKRIEKCPFPA